MDGILITELTMLRLPSQSQSQPATLTSSIDKHTQLRLGIPQCSELTEQDTPVRDCAQGIDSHLLCQPLVKLVTLEVKDPITGRLAISLVQWIQ